MVFLLSPPMLLFFLEIEGFLVLLLNALREVGPEVVEEREVVAGEHEVTKELLRAIEIRT